MPLRGNKHIFFGSLLSALAGSHNYISDLLVVDIAACLHSGTDHGIPHFCGKIAGRVVTEFHAACIFLEALLPAGNLIHIFPADRADFLQRIYHAVYRGRTNLPIQF